MRSCKRRLDDEILKLTTPMHVVATTARGPAEFELLPPFGPGLSSQGLAKFEGAYNLLAATFSRNTLQIKESVYRGRKPRDGSKSTQDMQHDACLVAALWLGGQLVCAASVRVNVPPRGGQHLQTVYQATAPGFQHRGLGRLLTRCIMRAAAEAGHKYTTVVVMGKEVEGYWTKLSFRRPTSRDEYAARTAVEHSKQHAPKSAVWFARLEPDEEDDDGEALEPDRAAQDAQLLVLEAAEKVVSRFQIAAAAGGAVKEPTAGQQADADPGLARGPDPTAGLGAVAEDAAAAPADVTAAAACRQGSSPGQPSGGASLTPAPSGSCPLSPTGPPSGPSSAAAAEEATEAATVAVLIPSGTCTAGDALRASATATVAAAGDQQEVAAPSSLAMAEGAVGGVGSDSAGAAVESQAQPGGRVGEAAASNMGYASGHALHPNAVPDSTHAQDYTVLAACSHPGDATPGAGTACKKKLKTKHAAAADILSALDDVASIVKGAGRRCQLPDAFAGVWETECAEMRLQAMIILQSMKSVFAKAAGARAAACAAAIAAAAAAAATDAATSSGPCPRASADASQAAAQAALAVLQAGRKKQLPARGVRGDLLSGLVAAVQALAGRPASQPTSGAAPGRRLGASADRQQEQPTCQQAMAAAGPTSFKLAFPPAMAPASGSPVESQDGAAEHYGGDGSQATEQQERSQEASQSQRPMQQEAHAGDVGASEAGRPSAWEAATAQSGPGRTGRPAPAPRPAPVPGPVPGPAPAPGTAPAPTAQSCPVETGPPAPAPGLVLGCTEACEDDGGPHPMPQPGPRQEPKPQQPQQFGNQGKLHPGQPQPPPLPHSVRQRLGPPRALKRRLSCEGSALAPDFRGPVRRPERLYRRPDTFTPAHAGASHQQCMPPLQQQACGYLLQHSVMMQHQYWTVPHAPAVQPLQPHQPFLPWAHGWSGGSCDVVSWYLNANRQGN